MNAFTEKIKTFFGDYRRDFICVGVLLLLYIITAIYIGPFYGCLYMDTGRELFIPEAVLNGKVMYKDVFMLYCPFSYYINAFLYFIFGVSLDSLLLFSYINGFIVLCGLYMICRMFIKEFFSAIFTFVIMIYFVLGGFSSLLSFILPYSYAFIYAVSFFIFSTLFFLYYMKDGSKKCLYFSAFLAGCIYACKFEFLLYVIPFFTVLLLKKENFKTFFISALLIMLPGLLCLGALFWQGVSVADFKEWFGFIKNTIYSAEYQTFEQNRIKLPWNLYSLFIMLRSFISFLLYITLNAFYISTVNGNKYYKFTAFICLPFYLLINYYVVVLKWDYTENVFNWHILVLCLIMIYLLFKLKNLRAQMLFFIGICGILAMYRINFLPLERYNYTIYFLTSLIPIWILFIDFKNEKLKNVNYKYYVSCALVVFSIFFLLRRETMNHWNLGTLNFPSGHLIAEKRYAEAVNKSVEWLNKNTRKTDTVLVLPEGVTVNFFSGNPTVLKYFQLSPNHIPAFGEEKIVEDLAKNKPDYILLTDTAFPAFDLGPFCESYGLLLCDFTYNNYDFIDEIKVDAEGSQPFSTRIYGLRDNL